MLIHWQPAMHRLSIEEPCGTSSGRREQQPTRCSPGRGKQKVPKPKKPRAIYREASDWPLSQKTTATRPVRWFFVAPRIPKTHPSSITNDCHSERSRGTCFSPRSGKQSKPETISQEGSKPRVCQLLRPNFPRNCLILQSKNSAQYAFEFPQLGKIDI